MKLSSLFYPTDTFDFFGSSEKEIRYLSQDTREDFVVGESLYFAVRGSSTDGHVFIPEAIEKGAVAIICEEVPQDINEAVCYIRVPNTAAFVGECASRFYENPSSQMTIVGVTGTNGKTSIATILSQSYEHLGNKTLLLSTAGDYFCGKSINIKRKAPSSLEAIELHRILREYCDKGATHCFLEVTSHAAHQHRQRGVNFDAAVFTNLSQDHLNYHGTFENYAQAKKMFFDYLPKTAIAIINTDDQYGNYMITDTLASPVTYGKKDQNRAGTCLDYAFDIIEDKVSSTLVRFNNDLLEIPAIGDFSVYNYLAVFACIQQLHSGQYTGEQIVEAIQKSPGAKGRFEMLEHEGVRVIIDYAHSPDALENVLKAARKITKGRLITVVGLGGTRDTSKRPIMGKLSTSLSDYTIFTSDNPRYDDPEEILNDITRELENTDIRQIFFWKREVDRAKAIQEALLMAQLNDVVIIAGKGHENYQEIKGVKYPFSDYDEVYNFWKK